MISLSPPRTLPCTLAKRPACVTACSRRTATRAVHLSQVTATVAEVAESSADGLAGLSPNEYVYVGLGTLLPWTALKRQTVGMGRLLHTSTALKCHHYEAAGMA